MRHHYTSVRITKIKKIEHTKHRQGCGRQNSHTLLERMTNVSILAMLILHLLQDPAIALLVFTREKERICPCNDMMQMSIAPLLKSLKLKTTQPPIQSWMVKQSMAYPSNAILLSHQTEIFNHATTWINLKVNRLNIRSQTGKENILYYSIYMKLQEMKIHLLCQISGCVKTGRVGETERLDLVK